MTFSKISIVVILFYTLLSCNSSDDNSGTSSVVTEDCVNSQVLDDFRGSCNVSLPYSSLFEESLSGTMRIINSNSIPNHLVGLFGSGEGSLNPNAISEQSESYSIPLNPIIANSLTPLLSTTGQGANAGTPIFFWGVIKWC